MESGSGAEGDRWLGLGLTKTPYETPYSVDGSPLVAADHVGEGRRFRGRRGRRGGIGDVGFRSSGVRQGGSVVEPRQEEALEEASRVQAPAGCIS